MSDPLRGASPRLRIIHEHQTHRDDWPDFGSLDASSYAPELRRPAARQWRRRAQEELGSVYEFTAVAHALAVARAPIEFLGGLSRLITDEVRHAELCGRMARALEPNEREWVAPQMPFVEPPLESPDELLRWAAGAILCSCCIGETLSRPLFEAAATVCTDPIASSVLRQILRDEHLHATFGWEALGWLYTALDAPARVSLEGELAWRLGQFERSCAAGVRLEDIAGTELSIEPGDPSRPNLAMLTPKQYATIFYATMEAEILPRFSAIGLDAAAAWQARR